MNEEIVIELKNVSKTFRIHHEKVSSLYEHLMSITKKNPTEQLHVLKNISFSIKKGEMLGIIGLNGSGKTTLLKIISNIFNPDHGTATIRGKLTPFLELGTGFNGELTARDNIILYGTILGFTKNEIKKKINEIVQFAGVEKFLDTKLKNFSAGMNARLAFSTAIQVDPDILLVDEVLAVGDIQFQKKSFDTFMSFKKQGKTIIFVTHSLDQILSLCDKALLLHNGRIRAFGNPQEVVEVYNNMTNNIIDDQIKNFQPWFHDFSKLGVNTAIEGLRVLTMKNQDDKEPIITKYMSKSFSDIKTKNPSLLDLFCKDGFYSILALEKFNPGKIVAIDNDQKMIEGAKFILNKLRLPDIEFRTQDITSINTSEKFDIVLNTGGLYHVENPEYVLEQTYKLTNKFAIIQSVVTLESEDENYFVTPAPNWTWGCRFTDAKLIKWIEKFDWKIVAHERGTLRANTLLCDQGSSYFLCKK